MVRRCIPPAIVVMLLLTELSQGSITLSLHSEQDLDNLIAGQTVAFEVILSGLDVAAGESLGYLATQVTFDPTVFQNPSDPIASAIVPDETGFLGFTFDDVVDASYDRLFVVPSMAPIVTDGVFFSFTLDVQASGKGEVFLGFVDYQVIPGNVIPEPSTGIIFVLGGALVMLCGGMARRVCSGSATGIACPKTSTAKLQMRYLKLF